MRGTPSNLQSLVTAGDLAHLEGELQAGGDRTQEELDAALCRAAADGRLAMVDALIAAGADVDAATTREGVRDWPVFVAVENLQAATLRHLLQAGAGVNVAEESQGWTPLHLAVDSEADSAIQTGEPMTTEVTRLLLEHGADPLARDHRGCTPLDLAAAYPHPQAFALLRAAAERC